MKYFLAMWCIEGFEFIQDITKYHPDNWNKHQLVNVLKDIELEPNPLNRILAQSKLRAQCNTQRQYEIYSFAANKSITKKSLDEWIDMNPQTLVDWIRSNGNKIYSDKNKQQTVIR